VEFEPRAHAARGSQVCIEDIQCCLGLAMVARSLQLAPHEASPNIDRLAARLPG
jgi:hypothetical protein